MWHSQAVNRQQNLFAKSRGIFATEIRIEYLSPMLLYSIRACCSFFVSRSLIYINDASSTIRRLFFAAERKNFQPTSIRSASKTWMIPFYTFRSTLILTAETFFLSLTLFLTHLFIRTFVVIFVCFERTKRSLKAAKKSNVLLGKRWEVKVLKNFDIVHSLL